MHMHLPPDLASLRAVSTEHHLRDDSSKAVTRKVMCIVAGIHQRAARGPFNKTLSSQSLDDGFGYHCLCAQSCWQCQGRIGTPCPSFSPLTCKACLFCAAVIVITIKCNAYTYGSQQLHFYSMCAIDTNI